MNKDFMIVYRERNHLCVDCGEPAAQRGPGSWFRYCEKCKEKRQAEQSSKQTLCWRCKNSVPDRYGERGCPWSRKSHSNKLQCAGMPAVCGREDKMKKQPEIHSRVKYFKALIGDGVTPKDRTKARQRKKGRK